MVSLASSPAHLSSEKEGRMMLGTDMGMSCPPTLLGHSGASPALPSLVLKISCSVKDTMLRPQLRALSHSLPMFTQTAFPFIHQMHQLSFPASQNILHPVFTHFSCLCEFFCSEEPILSSKSEFCPLILPSHSTLHVLDIADHGSESYMELRSANDAPPLDLKQVRAGILPLCSLLYSQCWWSALRDLTHTA